jgi:citrate synthase
VERIHTQIWDEAPAADNPFAANVCYCAGYDVYGDLLGQIRWVEYLYLLFLKEAPSPSQVRLLEGLAVALANPGPRDHGVHAAMSAAVGGSTHASCLMAALAVGAGQLGGAREVALNMAAWRACGQDLAHWRERLSTVTQETRCDVWPPLEHAPGFDPHGESCTLPVCQTLDYLSQCGGATHLQWLRQSRERLEEFAGAPLAMTGVAGAALVDLGLNPDEGEMLYLLLRLPGAAAHALEQRELGWRKFPFFRDGVRLAEHGGDAAPSHCAQARSS